MAMEELQDNILRILVKFPTRERPQKFQEAVKRYDMMATDREHVQYLVSLDQDDPKLQQYVDIIGTLNQHLTAVVDWSGSKIAAVNRDMDKVNNWDIIVLASDDMICQAVGWDQTIRNEFMRHYPDTDGTLFFCDGDPATIRHNGGNGLCTMCILGRKYYQRFKYIYHPDYVSLWCDNEYTDVAQAAGKMQKYDTVLFKHVHHSNTPSVRPDGLMQRTQSFYALDGKTYERRKKLGFPTK